MKPTFTLGIEEEYQTVDPETRDLRSHIHAEIIEKGKLILQERVKSEMHQSVVEVGKTVCALPRPRPIRLPTGDCRKLHPTNATKILCKTCNWWPARILSSGCTCT